MFNTHSHRASTLFCVRVYVQSVRGITSYTAFSLTGGRGGVPFRVRFDNNNTIRILELSLQAAGTDE